MPAKGKYAAFYHKKSLIEDYEHLVVAAANVPHLHPINLWQPRSRPGTMHNPLLTMADLFVWFYLRRQFGAFHFVPADLTADMLEYPLRKTDMYYVRRLYRMGCNAIGDSDLYKRHYRRITKAYTRGVPAYIKAEDVTDFVLPSHQMPHQMRGFFYPWSFIGTVFNNHELERCVATRDVIDLTCLEINDDEVTLGTFPLPGSVDPMLLRDEIALDLGNGFDLLPMCDAASGRCLQTVAISGDGEIRGAFDRRYAEPAGDMTPIYDVAEGAWMNLIEDLDLSLSQEGT